MASSRGSKPGSAFRRSKRSPGWQARRSCRQGTQPGTTCPATFGAGNIKGKFRAVTRCPDALVASQIVGTLTSCEFEKRMCRLSAESIRKKSNTP